MRNYEEVRKEAGAVKETKAEEAEAKNEKNYAYPCEREETEGD